MIVKTLTDKTLGFRPEYVWCPVPTQDHRTEPYPVPRTVSLGVIDSAEAGAKLTPHPFAVVVGGAGGTALVLLTAEAGRHSFNFVDFEVDAHSVKALIDAEGHADEQDLAERLSLVAVHGNAGEAKEKLLARGMAKVYALAGREIPKWWLRPIYCGWGDQVAASLRLEGPGPECRALAYCIQGLYERWIDRLVAHELPFGTVIVDAGWSLAGVWEPDPVRWPDLRGFIDRQHESGRKVLMWIPTWMYEGLPDEWLVHCDGLPLAANPNVPEYREFLRDKVTSLLSPGGFDADGFKIDQLQYTPNERRPRYGIHFGRSGFLPDSHGPIRMPGDRWGCEALYLLQKTIYSAAKSAKPDCLVTSSTAHPYFHDTFDMMRLHDTGLSDVPVFDAMKARADLSRAVLPHHPIDADDWVHRDYAQWLDYTARSGAIGVPCIFYSELFVRSFADEPATLPIPGADLRGIAQAWRGYLAPGIAD